MASNASLFQGWLLTVLLLTYPAGLFNGGSIGPSPGLLALPLRIQPPYPSKIAHGHIGAFFSEILTRLVGDIGWLLW